MHGLRFLALPTPVARAYQALGPDAHGMRPERRISDGDGIPCRHCLRELPAGAAYLVLAHRPFPAPQPYAEIGPIFLHAEACPRYAAEHEMPQMFRGWERLWLRGYGRDDRIVYGTGRIVPTGELSAASAALLADPRIAYIHVRSAGNGCYQARIERG
jgi:hypothetical protein